MCLSIAATSLPSKRVFDKTGQIVNHFRSLLKLKNVDGVLFLSKNKDA